MPCHGRSQSRDAVRRGSRAAVLCARSAVPLPSRISAPSVRRTTRATQRRPVIVSADHAAAPRSPSSTSATRACMCSMPRAASRARRPALLGLAPGDTAIADIAQRRPASLAPLRAQHAGGPVRVATGAQRQAARRSSGSTTRRRSRSIGCGRHRLAEHRAERLASATPDDNRITLGCIVVPVAFYEIGGRATARPPARCLRVARDAAGAGDVRPVRSGPRDTLSAVPAPDASGQFLEMRRL